MYIIREITNYYHTNLTFFFLGDPEGDAVGESIVNPVLLEYRDCLSSIKSWALYCSICASLLVEICCFLVGDFILISDSLIADKTSRDSRIITIKFKSSCFI